MPFKILLIVIMSIFALPLQAAAQTGALDFAGMKWRVTAKNAEVTTHMGREALALTQGRAWADEAKFKGGVISFDVAYDEHQVFVGAGWRADTKSRLESMYFRAHLNNKPDALQYTPVENRLSAWQIFSGPNDIAPVSQTYTDWNRVKIVVKGDKADIYFNSDAPVLHIPDLKADLASGAVTLRATGRNAKAVYFSNVNVRPLKSGETITGQPKPTADLPDGLLTKWSVSSPFSEDTIKEVLTLTPNLTETLTWQTLETETHGIANLSKTTPRTKGKDTVFIRMSINSYKAQMKELTFGYSDRVRIYVNGKQLYTGNAGWRVRDYRFLGTVGFFDSVGLDLKAGDNEVIIAVSETFGGWAWAGAIKDQYGIEITPN